jgi:hypothetical protein
LKGKTLAGEASTVHDEVPPGLHRMCHGADKDKVLLLSMASWVSIPGRGVSVRSFSIGQSHGVEPGEHLQSLREAPLPTQHYVPALSIRPINKSGCQYSGTCSWDGSEWQRTTGGHPGTRHGSNQRNLVVYLLRLYMYTVKNLHGPDISTYHTRNTRSQEHGYLKYFQPLSRSSTRFQIMVIRHAMAAALEHNDAVPFPTNAKIVSPPPTTRNFLIKVSDAPPEKESVTSSIQGLPDRTSGMPNMHITLPKLQVPAIYHTNRFFRSESMRLEPL